MLICSLLSGEALADYIKKAHALGMTALVEAHDETEIQMALQAGARVIGVNNRDLKTFTVDIKNSIRLRDLVPEGVLFVSESGIRTADDIRELAAHHVDAALIGETMMRAGNVKEVLAELLFAGKE